MNTAYALARVLHLLGVVFWIGGVAMVTTILIPLIRRKYAADQRLDEFEAIEGRFSLQAKFATLLTGASGFYMLFLIDGWSRYLSLAYWWMHAMTLVWALFTLVLFVAEPLVIRRIVLPRLQGPARAAFFERLAKVHWVLLSLSLIAIFGAVAGSHGLLFFS